SCFLACLSFSWPFAILEAVALDRELQGGQLGWDRVVYFAVLSMHFMGSSALLVASLLASCSRCLRFQLPVELAWAVLTLCGFGLLASSRPDEDLSPSKTTWYASLLMVLLCLPLRFHVSWLILAIAMGIFFLDQMLARPDSILLCFVAICAGRICWVNERAFRRVSSDSQLQINSGVLPVLQSVVPERTSSKELSVPVEVNERSACKQESRNSNRSSGRPIE
ncbi:Uncharacterized protein SCF082_LOCUS36006, partial [Durusdinium trenchii]